MNKECFEKFKYRIYETRHCMTSASEWRDYAIGIEDAMEFMSDITYFQTVEISELLDAIEDEYGK